MSKQSETAMDLLVIMASVLGEAPSALGSEWFEFAEAVAALVHSPKKHDRETIGRLCKAAVELP